MTYIHRDTSTHAQMHIYIHTYTYRHRDTHLFVTGQEFIETVFDFCFVGVVILLRSMAKNYITLHHNDQFQ